jgi:STAM-binding protein
MNFSYETDTSAQTRQLRPVTSQHGYTRSNQNPTWAPSNIVPSPFVLDWLRSLPVQLQETSRPLSYSEFIERMELQWQSLKDDSRPLKSWLRLAESIRRDAESFDKQADLESAFVEYAKAATILIEKIPTHPDYRVLSTTQRHDMGLVSYFHPMAHDCSSVGCVHLPYLTHSFRALHDFYSI